MNTKSELCSECGVGQLTPSTYSDEFAHNGRSLSVDGLECYVCSKCGADPVFTDQIRRNQLRIADAKRESDGLLTGAEIRSMRERNNLSQSQASELFGGGANAFSKYERGDVIQSAAMDRLIKVADFIPDVLDFLRVEAGLSPISVPNYGGYVQGDEIGIAESGLVDASLLGTCVVVSLNNYRDRRYGT